MKATWRLGMTVAGVTAVALWPMAAWRWHAIPAAVLVGLTFRFGLPLRPLLRRFCVVWLLSGLMGLGLMGQDHGLLRAGNLWLKSTLSVWAVSLLTHTTPLPELVAALRRLGMSRVWAEGLAFWGRYYTVLAEEWHRLQLARRARTMTRSRRLQFTALTNGLGVLFVRAYERAEQVHRAMLARGYRGELTPNPASATTPPVPRPQSPPAPPHPPR